MPVNFLCASGIFIIARFWLDGRIIGIFHTIILLHLLLRRETCNSLRYSLERSAGGRVLRPLLLMMLMLLLLLLLRLLRLGAVFML